ncbi:MAG: class I mannose-6-phosphate isomerase [Vicinamibacteraceae bacterium]|nr:class I mannose-6-phosphate isomerase [Vicinamibacteraceae bacterium]
MRPVRLRPTLSERPWGRDDLRPWAVPPPDSGPIGEAWFSARDSDTELDETLGALIARDHDTWLGPSIAQPHPDAPVCPLLLKVLFTSDRLSIQVHPDDEYAQREHGSLGKTEAWHVLAAGPGASLGLGFVRPLSREEAVAAAQSGAIETLLDWRAVTAGDTFLVPARTVHALGPGLTIVEVQEYSDLTYRLYDYGRPRELHLERGFEVAELGPYHAANARVALDGGRERIAMSPYFVLERLRVDGKRRFHGGEPFYHLLVVTSGAGQVAGRPAQAGDVFFVPAATQDFDLEFAHGELLVSYTAAAPTGALGGV